VSDRKVKKETMRTAACIGEYLTPDYQVNIAEPASPHRVTDWLTPTIHPQWCHIASIVACLGSLAYCATLGGAFGRDQLLMTSSSSIISLSDRGKP